MTDTNSQQTQASAFRRYLPDVSLARFATMQKQNAHEYTHAFKTNGQPPWLHGLFLHWRELFKEPFRGVTSNGKVRDGLFTLKDDGIAIEPIVLATTALLEAMDETQRQRTQYHIDSPEWRSWSNPEFLLSDKGIRLDEITPDLQRATLKVLQLTLSPEGYNKAIAAMRINHFLGDLVSAPTIMNEFSYNFVLFGEPSVERPWGFSFYGHHLCLNIFFYKSQIIISPWFTGAEPNLIDEGPYKGTRILHREEALGLRLMKDLSSEQQAIAQVYKLMKDPAMPRGRWNHDDQRHLCGAYRDNRVVPYEGVLVSKMTTFQQSLILEIIAEYLLYLPEKARQDRLQHIKTFFDETYWCWIGGFEDDSPFYYRIQSPVVIIEFDHHSGVFLNNKEPAKFHIHTLLRTPNGGDYGMALRPLIEGKEQGYLWENLE